MNIENVRYLSSLLKQIGFEQMESAILRKVCFRPSHFELKQSFQKDSDTLLFTFHFLQETETGNHLLQYYDVWLQKDLALSSTVVGSIDIAVLEKNMASLDWKNIFTGDHKNWSSADKAYWETAGAIDDICEKLDALSLLEEGKNPATKLKFKYWSGNLPDDIAENIESVKSKSDISQRFYFSPDNVINIDEAYRFLQNKWIEKQLQQKDKATKRFALTTQQPVQKKREQHNPKNKQKESAV